MSDSSSDPRNAKFAWREVPARTLPKRSVTERAADFLEIYGAYDEATAREQASRCIQCPNPTCVQGCPVCNPIPQWLQLTAEGRFLEAAAVIGSATNLPEICARMCPADHLCEGQCLLESMGEPVSIRSLEQFLVDYAFVHGAVDSSAAPPNGFKIAVVGSGPAGLACADALSKEGFAVTVQDAAILPGGLLVNGVPAFELEGSIVSRRIELLEARGVKFQLGVELGRDITLGELRGKYDAVFLGMDAREARPFVVRGAELQGVVQAVPFLLQKSTAIPLVAPEFKVEGKQVVVIGGGDMAIDCVRSAIRYGARAVTCVYRRSEKEMPCRKPRYAEAVEEGGQFLFQAIPVKVLESEGRVTGVQLARTSADGLATPGTEFEIQADWVIPAIGFMTAASAAKGLESLRWSPAGHLIVDEHQMTSVPGVFAAGDLVRGPSSLLEAVRDARRAAAGIQQLVKAKA